MVSIVYYCIFSMFIYSVYHWNEKFVFKKVIIGITEIFLLGCFFRFLVNILIEQGYIYKINLLIKNYAFYNEYLEPIISFINQFEFNIICSGFFLVFLGYISKLLILIISSLPEPMYLDVPLNYDDQVKVTNTYKEELNQYLISLRSTSPDKGQTQGERSKGHRSQGSQSSQLSDNLGSRQRDRSISPSTSQRLGLPRRNFIPEPADVLKRSDSESISLIETIKKLETYKTAPTGHPRPWVNPDSKIDKSAIDNLKSNVPKVMEYTGSSPELKDNNTYHLKRTESNQWDNFVDIMRDKRKFAYRYEKIFQILDGNENNKFYKLITEYYELRLLWAEFNLKVNKVERGENSPHGFTRGKYDFNYLNTERDNLNKYNNFIEAHLMWWLEE